MKTRKIVLLAAALLAGTVARANAQVGAVTAPVLEGIMTATHADQIIYYAQSILQMVENATNTYNQFQNMLRAEQRALNNLKGLSNVKSFDDFMDWYNRQLYLDRQAEQRFTRLGVKIGSKTYRVADIENIPGAAKESYVDYWKNEFSDEQRKQMWINLGMTPSNYAYVQTWKTREKELMEKILTKKDVINEENMEAAQREQELLKALEEDAKLPEDQRMGEKALAQMTLKELIELNRTMRNMAYDQAEAEERRLAREKAGDAPPNTTGLSGLWGKDMFEPLSEEG
jgi:ASC-1-like (ASCH) protein